IVLWETLAKKRLFKGEGEADTLNRVLYEPIPTLRSANPLVHPDLEAVAMKALEREPDARFSTCSEMADALEAAARTANVSGVHKDVSTHLDAVIGTDISQQRDAVRAWLARSEPSKSGDPRLDGVKSKRAPKPSELASATKIEAGRASREPKQPGDSSSNVSSVSSTVLETVPEPAASSGVSQATGSSVVSHRPEVPAPNRSRAGWVVAAISTLLLVAGAAFVKFRPPPPVMTSSPPTGNAPAHAPSDAPTTALSTAAPSAVTPTLATAPVTPSTAVAPGTPAASGAPITTAAPSSRTRPGRVPHTTKPATSTPPAASTPVLPDDISHNPYR
ncbi:MAG: serine/threonine protein kinase, partial [Myxococcaceae bacterium]|nr:serine/threonine protein kinase [Myxococcaceae bacterium]